MCAWRFCHAQTLWLCLLTLVVAGCPSKTIQYPVEHERLLRLDEALESLRSAYQRKDRTGFKSMLLPLEQMDELHRQVEADFETFDAITLEFKIERVLMEKDELDVLVNWQGTWKKDVNDSGLRLRSAAEAGAGCGSADMPDYNGPGRNRSSYAACKETCRSA